jgi:hypothetical protein
MTWLRYVAFDHIGEFEAKGWKLYAPMQGNHGTYAVLMIWEGSDEPQ